MTQTLAGCAVLGKVEGEGKLWHGHVTAVTVAPDYRRMGLASNLMSILEQITDIVYASCSLTHWIVLIGLFCAEDRLIGCSK